MHAAEFGYRLFARITGREVGGVEFLLWDMDSGLALAGR